MGSNSGQLYALILIAGIATLAITGHFARRARMRRQRLRFTSHGQSLLQQNELVLPRTRQDAISATKYHELISGRSPTVLPSIGSVQNCHGYGSTCSICVEAYSADEDVHVLSCSHIFHLKCIERWLNEHAMTCPIWYGNRDRFSPVLILTSVSLAAGATFSIIAQRFLNDLMLFFS
jgi:hypothetical protein